MVSSVIALCKFGIPFYFTAPQLAQLNMAEGTDYNTTPMKKSSVLSHIMCVLTTNKTNFDKKS